MNMMSKLVLAAALSSAALVQAAPVVNVFELGIQPGKTAAYDAVGERNIRQSVANEAGTLTMYSLRSADTVDTAYMFEIYADEAAYQAHLQSPQYREFVQKSPEILTNHKQRTELVAQYLGEKRMPLALTEAMRVNLVTVTLKPEAQQAFRDVVIPEMVQSMKVEDGMLAMYAATVKSQPEKWVFLEVYASEAAYQQHRNTPHFKDYIAQTADMSSDKAFINITPVLLQNKGGLNFNMMTEQ